MSPYSGQNTMFWRGMSGQAVVQGEGRYKDFGAQANNGAFKL